MTAAWTGTDGVDRQGERRAHAVLQELFGRQQPVIAMMHLLPLPGRPGFDQRGGMRAIVEGLRRDLDALQAGGVDALLFCNEGDRPYRLHIDRAQVAAMAAAIGEVRSEVSIPFGVDMLWDPFAAIALAQATGATFVREVFTGVYDSDMGLWQPDAAAAVDYRNSIGAQDVRLFFNIEPEFGLPLAPRPIEALAKSVATSSLPDVLLISGPMAGAAADLSHVREAQSGAPQVPVFANTGVKIETVAETLAVADGIIVGSGLKVDGGTWNPVDPERVRRFMTNARSARGDAA